MGRDNTRRGPCFETHRSAREHSKNAGSCMPCCDAPQHEAEPTTQLPSAVCARELRTCRCRWRPFPGSAGSRPNARRSCRSRAGRCRRWRCRRVPGSRTAWTCTITYSPSAKIRLISLRLLGNLSLRNARKPLVRAVRAAFSGLLLDVFEQYSKLGRNVLVEAGVVNARTFCLFCSICLASAASVGAVSTSVAMTAAAVIDAAGSDRRTPRLRRHISNRQVHPPIDRNPMAAFTLKLQAL